MTLPSQDFWRGRRVLITGHTGFQGGWLALLLSRLGATVTGYALPPEFSDGIYPASGIAARLTSVVADIRHASVLRECMLLMRPEIVVHLAARSRGHAALEFPADAYDINTVGTVKVLEEARRRRGVRAVVIVTSDKVYAASNPTKPFVESDPLGGNDPYGASQAAAEFAVTAFRNSVAGSPLLVATARVGEVFGGGDWTQDRVVPDAIRAFAAGSRLAIRDPDAVRPWQYVLDPLCGYLLLAERLFSGDDSAASAWNFGPEEAASFPVSTTADLLVEHWNADGGLDASWEHDPDGHAPRDTPTPGIDSAKARQKLGWRPQMDVADGLAATVAWHKAQMNGGDMPAVSIQAIDTYLTR